MARSEWAPKGQLEHVLAALTPENRLVSEVCMRTGLRIGDALTLRTNQLAQRRFTVQEQKTGKNRRIYLPNDLRDRLIGQAGKIWVFPHRTDGRKHRCRQAVYKDIKRAAKAFRMPQNITPHSLRKAWAVGEYQRLGRDLEAVMRTMNHSDPAITMLYVMADELTNRKGNGNIAPRR